jgi:ABC-type transport system involved in cytochrome c biogenesis permease subunit
MEPTVHDLVVWGDDVALSTGQLQKAFDWRITQWATLSNAILTAIFFLITTGLVETYKQTLKLRYFWAWVGAAVLIYCCSYLFCRLKIRRLRREFLALYTLLQEIA